MPSDLVVKLQAYNEVVFKLHQGSKSNICNYLFTHKFNHYEKCI